MPPNMRTHLPLCKLASKHGLETRDIGLFRDQRRDDVIPRFGGRLQTDVAAQTTWVVA